MNHSHLSASLTPCLACLALCLLMISSCNTPREQTIPANTISALQHELCALYTDADADRMGRGIQQAAALWTEEDGTTEEFCRMVKTHYCGTDSARRALFGSVSKIIEQCYESADLLTVDLLKPTQLTNAGEPEVSDWIMSAYSPLAHFADDMFANRLAFVTIINFPHYSLEEKNLYGKEWSREEWAMARMGDVFTTRVPAKVKSRLAQAYADAENYIADYNIYMGNLRSEDGRQLWTDDKILLAHWNLRDELKALYGERQTAGTAADEKQEMIYQVMQRIVRQDIPQAAINNPDYVWQPYSSTDAAEPYTRYERILAIAHAMFAEDPYCPTAPTGINRNFEGEVEIPAAELDSLFRALVSSPQVKNVAAIIRERLGRDLRPYDIWYDGFKARASLNEDELTSLSRTLYPNADAFAADMPRLLTTMGFSPEDAKNIAAHIVVEPARGSGHAWPCVGTREPARLRTRIAGTGMDYKGYNIAVHEFGHCVEEVLNMYYTDYYMLSGIPNSAYTEASAFIWQQRDLQLLPRSVSGSRQTLAGRQQAGLSDDTVLDQFWSMYEIMGVSLVDMAMWEWIYAHPKASAKQLCEATLQIAKEVWNAYYEPVLGEHDCVLLAVYSHMVNAPMYLPNYPLGHIVQYQIEEHLAQCTTQQEFAAEYARIYSLGRLTPKQWMIEAVGHAPSVTPILNQVAKVCD